MLSYFSNKGAWVALTHPASSWPPGLKTHQEDHNFKSFIKNIRKTKKMLGHSSSSSVVFSLVSLSFSRLLSPLIFSTVFLFSPRFSRWCTNHFRSFGEGFREVLRRCVRPFPDSVRLCFWTMFSKISTNFQEISKKFLETSRKFVEISWKFLEISRKFVEISRFPRNV